MITEEDIAGHDGAQQRAGMCIKSCSSAQVKRDKSQASKTTIMKPITANKLFLSSKR